MNSRQRREKQKIKKQLNCIKNNTIRFNSHNFHIYNGVNLAGHNYYELRCKRCDCYIYAAFQKSELKKLIQRDYDQNTMIYKNDESTEILESKRTFTCKDFLAEIDAKDILE